MFTCRKCGETKPLDEFTPNKWTPSGHTNKCKACCALYEKEWRKRNPDKTKEQGKRKYERWRLRNPSRRVPRVTEEGRFCPTCALRKPDGDFGRLLSARDGYSSRCKQCTREAAMRSRYMFPEQIRERDRIKANKRYAKYPEKIKAQRKIEKLKYKFGLTPEDRLRMLSDQDGRCAICEGLIIIPTSRFGRNNAQIDHDHKTGAVRGLLCVLCNGGLGAFRDNQAILTRAIEYLRRHDKA